MTDPTPLGMDLDPNTLIRTQNTFIAQDRIKEVQLEAAITQLRAESFERDAKIAELEDRIEKMKDAKGKDVKTT